MDAVCTFHVGKNATECESYQLGYNLSNAYVDKLHYLLVYLIVYTIN